MPTQETITESYWTVCWAWIIPYPCKKYRTVTKWCYDFLWIKEHRYLFFAYLEGCEHGILYDWYDKCFLLLGTVTLYNIRKCFSSKRHEVGKCPEV